MPRTLANAVQPKEVQSLDGIRLRPATAHLDSPTQSNAPTLLDRLAAVKKSALMHAHGSGKVAALEVGCDQSQLNRQLAMGTFDTRQEAAAGAAYLAALGAALLDEFGAARKSKKQVALERIPELVALMLAAATEDE
jgi:hypothetical protein